MDFSSFFSNTFQDFVFWFKRLWLFFLPLFLGAFFWSTWMGRINNRFLRSIRWVLLEIKLPREIFKSPKAMEVVLNVFHSGSGGNFLEKYWQGKLQSWSSLEIAGINGSVHFFAYIPKALKNLVEAQFYSQYPGIEIVEVDDYSRSADFFDQDEWKVWGTEFVLTKEDAFPIRTYVDYGLHETVTKEEQKTDPLTSLLEFLGSLKNGEQAWFQFLIRGTQKDWAEEGKKAIDKIIGLSVHSTAEDRTKAMSSLLPGQIEAIKAVERSVSKNAFDLGIRAMYVARRDIFNGVNKAGIIGSMKHYNSLSLNGFKPKNAVGADYFFVEKRETAQAERMLSAYQKRSYFYPPHIGQSFVLNIEELATVFHFPGRVAETPTFGRIEAKKSQPPINLPI